MPFHRTKRAADRMSGLAEELSNASLACRQVGPIQFKEKFAQGDEISPSAPPFFFRDADRARLRRQAERAVYVAITKRDEGSPENSTATDRSPWGTGERRCSEW